MLVKIRIIIITTSVVISISIIGYGSFNNDEDFLLFVSIR